jgi:hypothetical protein
MPEAPAPRRIAITEAKHRAQPRVGPELKFVPSQAAGELSRGGGMNIELRRRIEPS